MERNSTTQISQQRKIAEINNEALFPFWSHIQSKWSQRFAKNSAAEILTSAFIVLTRRFTSTDESSIRLLNTSSNYVTINQELHPDKNESILNIKASDDALFTDIVKNVSRIAHVVLSLNSKFKSFSTEKDFHIQFMEEPKISIIRTIQFILANAETHNPVAIMEFKTDLSTADLIHQLKTYYLNLLDEIVQNPEKKISSYQLIDQNERNSILFGFNQTDTEYPDTVCIHHLFENQVNQSPNAIALHHNGLSMTYAELNQKANVVAYQLIDMGIQPDDPVCLLTDLSFDAIIGLFGILKAGGCYVPLHADNPPKRHQWIINQAQPKAVVTNSTFNDLIQFNPSRTIVLNKIDFAQANGATNPSIKISSRNLAYIIYTSGSTGTPKGVEVEHVSVVNHLMFVRKRYRMVSTDAILSMPTLAFDASVPKLFPILSVGGSCILPNNEEAKDVEKLLELGKRHKSRYFGSTPTMIRILNELNPDLSGIDAILCGGETLHYQDIDKIVTQVPVVNIYGPTETTVSASVHWVPKGSDCSGTRVPIGKANPNYRMYILDDELKCLPVGCPGRLYIGGIGLARGYHREPRLTSEKFINNPFLPGERIYDTGDTARWLPEGYIDFLGRTDDQIKLRGYRISTSEIERVLCTHPQVKEARVITRTNEEKISELIAFIKVNAVYPDLQEIKRFLEENLPHFMIPSDLIAIDKWPLNQNNKIDSITLLNNYLKRGENRQKEKYKNDIEASIARYCMSILQKKELAGSTNLFQIGAHSLHAMQIKLFLGKEFRISASVADVFENPTIEKLAELIQSKAIQLPHHENNGTSASNKSANRINRDLIPLTYAEKRLWFLYNLMDNKALYNIVKAYRVTGNLNLLSLQKALQHLVERHENLRKFFIEIDGEPYAKISKKTITPQIIDSSQLLHNQIPGELINNQVIQPFNLKRDLPIRVTAAATGKGEYYLIFSFHHIISDAWSSGIFFDELKQLYEHYENGKAFIGTELSASYLQYATLEADLISNLNPKLLESWKQEVVSKLNVLKLPYDFPDNPVDSSEGNTEEMLIPDTLCKMIEALAREKQATLFMTFFSAFQSLIHIYTQQDFISTGFPVATRQSDSTKGLIGFFVNTLILPTDFSSDPDFETLLDQVRKEIIKAYNYQDIPFDMLLTEMRNKTGNLAHGGLQVMFNFQGFEKELELPDVKVDILPIKTNHAKFDLTFSMKRSDAGYVASAEYKTGKFRSETIHQMLSHFRRLLSVIAVNSKTKISGIDLLDHQEKHNIYWKHDQIRRSIPKTTIQKLFELQVEKTPESTALTFNDTIRLSYSELNKKANQLAHVLKEKGICAAEPVGILLQENHAAIIAILAVLKAGGAYVPLDPTFPGQRLQLMMDQAGVRMIVSTTDFTKHLPPSVINQIICLDKIDNTLTQYSSSNPDGKFYSDQLAYIMFTSGSTGGPKAVGISHIGVVRLVINTNYLTIDEHTRLLKTGAFTFDASTFEVWGSLLNGGQIFLYPDKSLLSPGALKEKIIKNRIDTLWMTTAWFVQVAEITPEIFQPLKTLVVGGERLMAKHVNKVIENNHSLEIINGYGPTENTTFSTFHRINNLQQDPIPIGIPIANSTVRILNKSMVPVPTGVEGEIYVGGPGVALGYMNDPEKTKFRFLKDPYCKGQMLYKTGDTGKWTRDGKIIFTGRNDNQIKLRGYRIEVEEIERELIRDVRVREVAVVPVGTDQQKQLVAFYTGSNPVPSIEFNDFLSKKLPSYMIPAGFLYLENLPLNKNGKIDKNSLSQLASTYRIPDGSSNWEAPRGDTEIRLAKIWEEVLGKNGAGATDNFFTAGGHSLMAVKLLSRIEREFGRQLQVSVLFEAPTIRSLGQFIDSNSGKPDRYMVIIQPKGSRLPFFVIPGYLFYHNLAIHLGNDQPLYGFEPVPNKNIKETAAHYIKEMKEIQPNGPYFLGGYCAGGIMAYEMATQLIKQGDQIGLLALFEAYTPEGTLPKTSFRYIMNRLRYFTKNFNGAHGNEKFNVINKELKRVYNYVLNGIPSTKAHSLTPIDHPIKLFTATEGMVGSSEDPLKGWANLCPMEKIELIAVPGNHDTMFKEPHVKALANKLKDLIHATEYTAQARAV